MTLKSCGLGNGKSCVVNYPRAQQIEHKMDICDVNFRGSTTSKFERNEDFRARKTFAQETRGRSKLRMNSLPDIPAFGADGTLRVIVETPRGSNVKLKYDQSCRTFTVSRALVAGLSYPFDWGFAPGTQGDDGETLDALAIHDTATFPGVM
jgi:Inorganic pyrophosphatase